MADAILVVEDDPRISELIVYTLRQAGFAVMAASDGLQAVDLIRRQPPELVVLDLMLPGMDGLEVCRSVRQFSRVPILILTALKDEVDRVVGLEVGADDYVTKPFSPRELMSRVKAILRRAAPPPTAGAVRFGPLRIDFEAFEVTRDGEPVAMTVSEFRILQVLVSQPGRVFTREELLDRARGADFFGEQRTVDVHVRHLRAKLEPDPSQPQLIETVRGVGYRFRSDPARPGTG